MEALASPSPTYLKILSSNSPFTSQFPTKAWRKNQITYNTFYRNSTLPIPSPLSNKTSFLVFSQFGRRTSRRNSLRKKLIQEHEKLVRHIPSTQQSSPSLEDRQKLDDNIDTDNEKDNGFSAKELGSKSLGESVLFNKLESWVEQYKKDTEFWGIGSGPIFTVFMSSDGNVERVSVDKGEILRRSGVEKGDLEGSAEANGKVLEAENLAREMESGNGVIPRNSSVAKFVVRGEGLRFLEAVRRFSLSPKAIQEVPRVGILLLYGFVAVWALRKLFDFRDKEVELMESEKEMMRRKIKSRKEREVLEIGGVEVVQEPLKQPMFTSEKPKLDKKELMKDIARAKTVTGNLALADLSISKPAKSSEFDDKIQEIRRMAREAREIEGGKDDSAKKGGKDDSVKKDQIVSNEAYTGDEEGRKKVEETTELMTHLNGDRRQISSNNGNSTGSLLDDAFVGNGNITSHIESSDATQSTVEDLNCNDLSDYATSGESDASRGSSVREKPRIIRSVKEAREYLSEKHQNRELKQELQCESISESVTLENLQSDKQYDDVTQKEFSTEEVMFRPAISDGTSVSSPVTNASQDSASEDDEIVAIGNGKPKVHEEEGQVNIQKQQISLDTESDGDGSEIGLYGGEESWNENNVDEQIGKKIGLGFRDSYMAARKKKDQLAAVSSSMEDLASIGNNELDWMEDDHLAEIVFRVRENELAGRDPFYKMEAEDKDTFFKGLEKKVERENEKLSVLHEWLHSNIENLDYGIDGISLYDPPEKIIPRWKGPVLEKSPEFLNNFQEQRKAIFAENTSISNDLNKNELLQKPKESSPDENIATSSAVNDPKKKVRRGQKTSKTIIEASDGSVKTGKKSGKEFWQHTKKWSRGFLESYNAETDPEVKSIMKDMGKDLDRWITEKEIQEAAELMDKLPEKNKEFMNNKLSKLKREMELFGPQAVVSKYREYADDNKEDYLWWLDLPHILCIELYTVEDGEQRVGFYSLEMATDLELEPKPHHVIAFEDANDCKNLCYIIQAQMEVLGNGHAFVVAQPPKDAFREAKENGFNVTVIRKGELQLNVDQTLEEVEEQISEIGSKMYHDMIMRERSVDISSLMKGVFGFKSRPTRTKRKRSKKMLKKRGKK